MKERKLTTYQASSIIITVMVSHIILNLPNHLIVETGSSIILNLIYVFIITLIMFFIVSKIFCLFPNSDIMDICEYTAGKSIKNIFCMIICAYLLTVAAFVIRTFADSLVLIYFPNIDLEMVILIFITITTIMNLFGFKSISRSTVLILPIIIVSIIIIFISSIGDFTFERALPILGHGAYDTFFAGLRKCFCF